ncbi:MAG TPA: hypothetical protein VN823_03190 [Stellaceae bacterium]|nr:hypothetical protein [Stellaceae bacterium]
MKNGTYEPLKGRPRTHNLARALANTAFDAHIAEHASLLERFDDMVRALIDHVCESLKVWFVDHVIKQDAQMRTIFQALR